MVGGNVRVGLEPATPDEVRAWLGLKGGDRVAFQRGSADAARKVSRAATSPTRHGLEDWNLNGPLSSVRMLAILIVKPVMEDQKDRIVRHPCNVRVFRLYARTDLSPGISSRRE
jgi:hypothetical protein